MCDATADVKNLLQPFESRMEGGPLVFGPSPAGDKVGRRDGDTGRIGQPVVNAGCTANELLSPFVGNGEGQVKESP